MDLAEFLRNSGGSSSSTGSIGGNSCVRYVKGVFCVWGGDGVCLFHPVDYMSYEETTHLPIILKYRYKLEKVSTSYFI